MASRFRAVHRVTKIRSTPAAAPAKPSTAKNDTFRYFSTALQGHTREEEDEADEERVVYQRENEQRAFSTGPDVTWRGRGPRKTWRGTESRHTFAGNGIAKDCAATDLAAIG